MEPESGIIETSGGKLSNALLRQTLPSEIAKLDSTSPDLPTLSIAPWPTTPSVLLRNSHRSRKPSKMETNGGEPTELTPAPLPVDVAQSPASIENKRPETEALIRSPSTRGSSDIKYAIGAGIYRLPRWIGSGSRESRFIPYVDINWQDQVDLSTVDGLLVDLIHGQRWHGGLVGSMLWGRSNKQLQSLSGKVAALRDTFQLGPYLEYAVLPSIKLGVRWRHDVEKTGASYSDIYANIDLPVIGPVEHSLRFSQEHMNRAAMNRLFGLSQQDAANLGADPYSPGAGSSRTIANYQVFLPINESSGFAVAAGFSRLQGAAAASPLVQSYGTPRQKEMMAAFVVQIN